MLYPLWIFQKEYNFLTHSKINTTHKCFIFSKILRMFWLLILQFFLLKFTVQPTVFGKKMLNTSEWAEHNCLICRKQLKLTFVSFLIFLLFIKYSICGLIWLQNIKFHSTEKRQKQWLTCAELVKELGPRICDFWPQSSVSLLCTFTLQSYSLCPCHKLLCLAFFTAYWLKEPISNPPVISMVNSIPFQNIHSLETTTKTCWVVLVSEVWRERIQIHVGNWTSENVASNQHPLVPPFRFTCILTHNSRIITFP